MATRKVPAKKRSSTSRTIAATKANTKAKTHRKARGSVVRSTPFVTAFVAALLRNDRSARSFKWPTPHDDRPAIQKDFGAVIALLLDAALTVRIPAAAPGDSLVDRVATFAAEQRWPLEAPVPPQWTKIRRTARFIEISLIADHLLEAINAHRPKGESGGSGSSWPPHGGG